MPDRTQYAPACDQPGADPDLWYREDAESMSIAKRLCGGCELEAACLSYAMTFPDEDQWGIWGGETAAGRRALRAADPGRYPVVVTRLEEFLGTRGERWGDRYAPTGNHAAYGDCAGPVRPLVDWAALDREELDDRVIDLMQRYENDTELGYGLTDESGSVHHVNNGVAA